MLAEVGMLNHDGTPIEGVSYERSWWHDTDWEEATDEAWALINRITLFEESVPAEEKRGVDKLTEVTEPIFDKADDNDLSILFDDFLALHYSEEAQLEIANADINTSIAYTTSGMMMFVRITNRA